MSTTCDSVSVELTNYGNNTDNTVTVTVDGTNKIIDEHFKNDFSATKPLPAHDKAVSVHFVIVAQDGEQYSLDKTVTVEPCKTTPPSTPPASESPTPTPSATPSSEAPAPSQSATVAPSSAAPAPSKSSDNLAETGSSSSTPLIAGTAAVVILAGGGIVWATRKRRSAQH
ncbi:LAETG motif-containing sortase-dependent surface protein [Streptomyces sp. NPDC050738]|uniref:LAETG motif-containing sortase-dependent surface protein n=1 Tax=Streptomyces sp. NPDC050738 TaxID=3154744 RepID=UPI00341E42A5